MIVGAKEGVSEASRPQNGWGLRTARVVLSFGILGRSRASGLRGGRGELGSGLGDCARSGRGFGARGRSGA